MTTTQENERLIRGAHYVNMVIRVGGRDVTVEGDWVKGLLAERDALREERDGLQATFDLRWKADQRARERWTAAHPDRPLTWPDHADLCVWLVEALETALANFDAEDAELEAARERVRVLEEIAREMYESAKWAPGPWLDEWRSALYPEEPKKP